jgi:hypothetical protein
VSKIKAKAKTKLKSKYVKSNIIRAKEKTKITPRKRADVPVTKGQFDEFQATIQHSLTSANLELKAIRKEFSVKFIEIDSKIEQLDFKFEAKFNQLDAKFEAKFNQLDTRIDQLEAKFEARFANIESMLHKILLVVEEQNARNKFVLDGYANLYDRFEEHKAEVDKRFNNIELQLMQSK